MEEVGTTRREQAETLINALDPSGKYLPQTISDRITREWRSFRSFFVKVCHNGTSSPEEFDQRLEFFEDFMVDRLGLRTFQGQEILQSLIREGEGHA